MAQAKRRIPQSWRARTGVWRRSPCFRSASSRGSSIGVADRGVSSMTRRNSIPTRRRGWRTSCRRRCPARCSASIEPLAFLLNHFWLLYAAILLFSAVELIVGFALMAGLSDPARGARCRSRLSVFADAAFRLAGRHLRRRMDHGLLQRGDGGKYDFVASGAAYSLDNVWLRRNPALANKEPGSAGAAAA